VCLLVELRLLERRDLRLREHQALLRQLGLERSQPLLRNVEIVSDPHAADASRRNRHALLRELVRDAELPPLRLLERQR
jgi:hypothetical protein